MSTSVNDNNIIQVSIHDITVLYHTSFLFGINHMQG